MEIILKNVRLAFFNGYEPGDFDGKLSYGAQLIIDPADKGLVAKLDDAIAETAKEKWGAKGKQMLDLIAKQDRICFRKGPKLAKNGEPYDGFADRYHLSCSSSVKSPPMLIKRDKSISTARDGDLYSGCYADVKLALWAQDNQYGRRINAQCLVFQKRSDGDAFAGGPPPSADGMDDLSDTGEELEGMMA